MRTSSKPSKILPLFILGLTAVIGIVATFLFLYGGNPDQSANSIVNNPIPDFPVAQDLDDLAKRSDHIVTGRVVKDSSTIRQVPGGERAEIYSQTVISVIEVRDQFKGVITESTITLGQAGSEFDPAPPVGSQVVLFLRKVPHEEARPSPMTILAL